jgi:hypothetical protein
MPAQPVFYENNVITNFHTTMVVPEKPTAGELRRPWLLLLDWGQWLTTPRT